MGNMIRFLCLPAADRARRTLPAIGLAFVLGFMITPDGWSQPLPQMIYVQLVLRETPDFSISSPRHLYETTTSPSLKLRSSTARSSKASLPQNQNATAVSNTMELGSTSCVRLITLTRPTTEYSLPSVLKTPGSLACSRLLPPHLSQEKPL